jgi:thymidylate kinase
MNTTDKFRRICLYAGPGVGKSRLSAWLYSALKDKNYNIELVREEIKLAAYQKKKPKGFEPLEYFTKQLRQEEQWLESGVDLIITDCPIALNTAYAKISKSVLYESFDKITQIFDNQYSGLHIILDRDHNRYVQNGRYQTHSEAKELDIQINNFIKQRYDNKDNHRILFESASNRTNILEHICHLII